MNEEGKDKIPVIDFEIPAILGTSKNPDTGTLEALMSKDLVCDEEGKAIAMITIDPVDNRIYSVQTSPYINEKEIAENNDEKICIIDDEGNVDLEMDTTRKIAREENLRYLVVSNFVIHEKKILFQKRSKNKKIDPGKLSVSAHGVAKQLYSSQGTKWKSIENIALVNSALELNEELRHGENEKPFNVRFWYGTRGELRKHIEEEKINNSDTIYLLPLGLDIKNNYPLKIGEEESINNRARAICVGYVFSEEIPDFSIDPSELESVVWKNSDETITEFHGNEMNQDTKEIIEATIGVLREQDGVDTVKKMLVKNVIEQLSK